MYDLIIIDDENIIRKGLEELIDWKSIGFRIVATFEDGKEAIEFLKNHHVDVVLTDIRMAEVSGLDVAKYVHDHKPGTKTVIISGYKEFEYAKKAIDYGVEYFLLKPTKFNEFYHTFSELKKSLTKKLKRNKLHEEKRKNILRCSLSCKISSLQT